VTHAGWTDGGRRPCRAETRSPSLQVVSVVSNKGGVGKTTIATNLAIFIRALREELPILIVALDDQTLVDRMFALESTTPPGPTIAAALVSGDLRPSVRLGQYGIHYAASPSPSELSELRQQIRDPLRLREILERSGWQGLVIVDTKSDIDVLTRNAIAASDLTLAIVKDHQSLLEADKVFDMIEAWGADRECARIVLSLVDQRVRYEPGESHDILALLLMRIRERGYPLFQTFISRSPRIEALQTNPQCSAQSILHGGRGSLVHEQMRLLAIDVLAELAADAPDRPDAASEIEWQSVRPASRACSAGPDATLRPRETDPERDRPRGNHDSVEAAFHEAAGRISAVVGQPLPPRGST
jgi:cellulose biosynthesis protein BcsQ